MGGGFIGGMSWRSPRIGGANSGLVVEGLESHHNDTTAPRLPRLRLAMTKGKNRNEGQENSPAFSVFVAPAIDRTYVADVRLVRPRRGVFVIVHVRVL